MFIRILLDDGNGADFDETVMSSNASRERNPVEYASNGAYYTQKAHSGNRVLNFYETR